MGSKCLCGTKCNSRDILIFAIFLLSIFSPFAYWPTIFLPYEPLHRTLQDVFEMDLQPSFNHCHILVAQLVVLFFLTISVSTCFTMGALHLQVCEFWLQQVTPRLQLTSKIFLTRKGSIRQDKIVKVFRSEQVLNGRVNQILSSLWITFHHFTILVSGVGLSFICINDWNVVFSKSIMGVIVPLGVCTTCFIEYAESRTMDKVWTRSREFCTASKAIVGRQSTYYKFACSLMPLDTKSAYPFFKIRRETFPLFIDQWIQFLVSILIVSG